MSGFGAFCKRYTVTIVMIPSIARKFFSIHDSGDKKKFISLKFCASF